MKREYSKEEMEGRIPADPAECTAARSGEYAGERTGENKPQETTGKSAGLESRSGSSNAEFGSILCCCGGKQISSGKSGGER